MGHKCQTQMTSMLTSLRSSELEQQFHIRCLRFTSPTAIATETAQGEIAVEFAGEFYRIQEFSP